MNKEQIYNKQYQLAKIKLNEWELSDWLPSKETIDKIVDIGQEAIDWASIPASFVPGLNLAASAAQAASAGIDLAQGQGAEAAWRGGAAAVGMLPGAGAAATTGTKVAKGAATAVKAADAAMDASKVASAATKVATSATDAASAAAATKAATSAARTAEKAAETATKAASSVAKTAETTAAKTTTQLVPYSQKAAPVFNDPTRVLARQYADKLAATKAAAAAGKQTTALARTGAALARTGAATGKTTTALAKAGAIAGRSLATATRAATLAKTAARLGTVAALGYAAKKVADALSQPGPDTKITPVNRAQVGVDVGQLGMFDPGEASGYTKSMTKQEMSRDPGERFRPTFYMTPSQLASVRRSTYAQSRALPTFGESYDSEMSEKQLKAKVRTAVKNYLSSKQGKELNNHLDDIRKQMET